MTYYQLENREMPWGGYGAILLTGMVGHRSLKRGRFQLERTGPFVPPIIDSGTNEYVLTDALREQIVEAGFARDFEFVPVVKARIAEVHWHAWDEDAEDPSFYPESGEPEDYILEAPHDRRLAKSLGDLWSFRPDHLVDMEDGEFTGPEPTPLNVLGVEAFDGRVWTYFSKEFADWLIAHSDGNVLLGGERRFRADGSPR